MTLDTEQRIERTVPAQTAAKPPPQLAEERGFRPFQTMDELRARHGVQTGTKHRVLRTAAAMLGGLLLFGALYAVILFLE